MRPQEEQATQVNACIVTGVHNTAARLLKFARIGSLAWKKYRSVSRAASAVRLLAAAQARHQRPTTTKCARAGGRYFWGFYWPGWPSAAFDRFIESELERVDPSTHAQQPLQTVIVAVTNRCVLRCEHCCEWEALNSPEMLSLSDLHEIVRRFQHVGAAQIMFSGGEPLLRFDDLVAVIEAASSEADFWVLTSGRGLTGDRARRLRDAGLTGIAVSLDHWDPRAHDRFRGADGSFAWAERAAAHAREAGLLLALSLCPTRAFVTPDNLERYARVATNLGAAFIQILEPKAVGRYAGHDVDLDAGQIELLERFAVKLNFDRICQRMPAIAYIESSSRRTGCNGAGDRYLYVDPHGVIKPCPFCRDSAGSALDGSLTDRLTALRSAGCPMRARRGRPPVDAGEAVAGRRVGLGWE